MGDCISWCNPVFKRVDTLPDVVVATRNHAYILPDNTIWILNEDGDGYLQMSTKNRDINIDSTDGSLVVVKESEGNESNFNLKVAPDIINRINILEGKTDKFVREVSVSKQDRQITLTYTYTDDTVKEVSFTDDDTVALLYDDTALVERIVALEGKLDNNTTYTITDGRLVGSDGSSVAIPATRTILHGSTFYASPAEDFGVRGGITNSQPYTLFHENSDGSYDLTPLSEMYKKVERLLNSQLIVMGEDGSIVVEPNDGVAYLKGYKVDFNDMEGKIVVIPPLGDPVDIPLPHYRIEDGKLVGSLGDEYDLPLGNQTTYMGDNDSVVAYPMEFYRVMFSGYKISETGLVTKPDKTTFQLPVSKPSVVNTYSPEGYSYYNIDGTIHLWYKYVHGNNFNNLSGDKGDRTIERELKVVNGSIGLVPRDWGDFPRFLGYSETYKGFIVDSVFDMWTNKFTVKVTSPSTASPHLYFLIPKNKQFDPATPTLTNVATIDIPNNNNYKIQKIHVASNVTHLLSLVDM